MYESAYIFDRLFWFFIRIASKYQRLLQDVRLKALSLVIIQINWGYTNISLFSIDNFVLIQTSVHINAPTRNPGGRKRLYFDLKKAESGENIESFFNVSMIQFMYSFFSFVEISLTHNTISVCYSGLFLWWIQSVFGGL